MRTFATFFSMLVLAATVKAQPEPDTLWTRTCGADGIDVGMCVRATTTGDYIMAGYSQVLGAEKMYLVKLSAAGDSLWTRTFDFGNIERANAVWPTDDGGYLLVGAIGYMDGSGTAILLVKTTSNGDTLWSRAYGWSGNDQGYAVQPAPGGGFVIAGSTLSLTGDEDVCLVRITATGDTLWTRTYPASHSDVVMSLEGTADGGFVLAGYSSVPPQVTPAFVMKTSAGGDLQWRREYGGLFNMAVLAGQTSEGGYMVVGTGVAPGPHLAPYLMKTDSAGNVLWTRLHSASPLDEATYGAQRTADGGYILTGFIGNIDSAIIGMELIRLDSLGDKLWDHTYGVGTQAVGMSVVETDDHGYVVAGYAFGGAGYDLYAVATGPEGLVLTDPDHGEALAIGRPLEVRWNGTVYGGDVSLAVNRSYPSAAWETVATAAPNNGRYLWIVDGTESDHVRFRIQHTTLLALSDTSDTDLSFRIPRVRLLWPNGGETVLAGVRDTVRFQRILARDTLTLQLNRDYPAGAWEPLAGSIIADSTAFWIVQTPGSVHCRLRLVSVSDASLADTSDADFELRAPQMTLTAPNGGEQLAAGVPYPITWSAPEHQGNIRITLNRDYPGGEWEVIAPNVPNNGQRLWTPTAPASEHCRVRIATLFDSQCAAESAADFAITAAAAGPRPNQLPTTFALDAPYPNPFNAQTTLSFSIPARGAVSLFLIDLSGREVRVVAQGILQRGFYRIPVDVSELPSGTYFSRLQWGSRSQVQKLLLLR